METERPWGRVEDSGDDGETVGSVVGSDPEALADEQWRAGGLDPDGEADAGIDDDELDSDEREPGLVAAGPIDVGQVPVGMDPDGEVEAGVEDDEPEAGQIETGQLEAGELDIEVLDAIEQELADVERALERLGDGSYGQCESCGQALSDEELESSPAGRFCPTHRTLDLSHLT
jgi:hypothetical protein